MNSSIVIGVSGGSASGKTTVTDRLKEEFGDSVVLLSQDYYYLPYDNLPFEERIKLNYDHPNAFDTERFIEDIKALKQGDVINRPVYSYREYTRMPETIRVNPGNYDGKLGG